MTIFYRRHLNFVLLFKLLYVLCRGQWLTKPSNIVLENNGFKNVVIALHDSVDEDPALIDKLKKTLSEASKVLYTATRKRAYFKEITILLPSSWTTINASAATTETLQFADVIVSDISTSLRHLPQARSYRGCGQQGIHVLLTKEFLTNTRVQPYYAKPEKFFVHAWAEFRWGVFQEYGEEGELPFYFSIKSSRPEAIRCSFHLRGLISTKNNTLCNSNFINPRTGLYFEECFWRPYPYHQAVIASIMDYQFIQEIETFCDDEPTNYKTLHNNEAPSKHNRLCEYRSTWDVITSTDDFNNNKNPPRDLSDSELVPQFKIVKATSRRKRSNRRSPGADIVKNDGIYSRYYTNLGLPGRYHVSLHVQNSTNTVVLDKVVDDIEIPHTTIIAKRSTFGPVVRKLTGQSFFLEKDLSADAQRDVVPPSRIRDLQIVEINGQNKSVELTWTAPGDDMDDYETVHHYDLFIALNIKNVSELLLMTLENGRPVHESVWKETVQAIHAFGYMERFLWKVPLAIAAEEKLHFAVAIRGVDKTGNCGKISNVVTFSLS
ncbi:hypothetical protein CHS0354_033016 [Potamilus streckersoni]|uniref:Calcium-activated chloride channel N-terminal domain-containing protein n=1 Tax=Potamilus streckersoni TaxID=2493646 RepID=A0AAE0RXA8_9BIVA|nr:hypothetical protein CHS0354_033016 [Potamilus streckersoni]